MDSSLQNLEELPPRTFKHEEHSKQNHSNYLPRSQSSLESSSKASENLNKPPINKALQIQASKAPKNFHHKPSKRKNTRRKQRTRRTHKEREEQRISKQAHSQKFIVIPFQRSLIHSSAKLKDILFSNQNHITTNLSRRSNQRITLL